MQGKVRDTILICQLKSQLCNFHLPAPAWQADAVMPGLPRTAMLFGEAQFLHVLPPCMDRYAADIKIANSVLRLDESPI